MTKEEFYKFRKHSFDTLYQGTRSWEEYKRIFNNNEVVITRLCEIMGWKAPEKGTLA